MGLRRMLNGNLYQTRSCAVSVSPGHNADVAEDVHQRLKASTQKTQRLLQGKLHVVSLHRLSLTKCQALWAQDPGWPTPTQLGRQQGTAPNVNARYANEASGTSRLMAGARTSNVGRDASQTVAKPGNLALFDCTTWATFAQGIPHARCSSSAHAPHATGSIKQSSWQAWCLLAHFVVFGALLRRCCLRTRDPHLVTFWFWTHRVIGAICYGSKKKWWNRSSKTAHTLRPLTACRFAVLRIPTPSTATAGPTCRASARFYAS